MKSLTGGEEIKARHLNKGFFKFWPVFKASMSGNDMPSIGGVDNGIWRRVRLVPWEVTIPDAERRPMDEVLAEFAAERSGILNWLIEGLRVYVTEGLQVPAEVQQATAAYREEMDPIAAFAADCISVAPDACTRDTALNIIVGQGAPTPYGCMIGGLTTLARQSEGGLLIERYAVTRCEGRPD